MTRVATGAAASGQAYALAYNGRLPASMTASGLVNNTIEYQYTTDMWLRMVRITGRLATDCLFDADGLITRGGH